MVNKLLVGIIIVLAVGIGAYVLDVQIHKPVVNAPASDVMQSAQPDTATPASATTGRKMVTPSATSALANPASVNCTKQGGTLKIEKNGSGGEFGLCMFSDDQACEEWALYRGQCPVGGVKTIGFDNRPEMYCAWLGGHTLAVKNAQCTLPNGTTCSDTALYSGTCE